MAEMAYFLEALSPFHLGLRGVGVEATTEHCPSDTLFSALCHAILAQSGAAELKRFLDSYPANEPALVLSSAFPFAPRRRAEEAQWQRPDVLNRDNTVRFYPRPLELPPSIGNAQGSVKELKRITWVSEGIFRAWVEGDSLAGHHDKENVAQGGRIWLAQEERKSVAGWRDIESDALRLWSKGDSPRVTVDRITSSSQVYQAGRVWFQPGGGLWLLMRWRADWRQQGELALRILGDEGIGGERSAGHGQFRLHGPYELDSLPSPIPGKRFLTLSLYYPKPGELKDALQGDDVHYQFSVRRGWMSSPNMRKSVTTGQIASGSGLRRKSVHMFAEGSLLYWPSKGGVLGSLADVTPGEFPAPHPVFRYGLAFPVGYRCQAKEADHG